jgi:hypothetical protein
MSIPPYRIHFILRHHLDHNRHYNINRDGIIQLQDSHGDSILPSDIKKDQLIDQIIFKAIAHLTTGVWEKKGRMVPGDLLHDLSDEDGRRKLYETLIQDSRRR